MNVFISWAGADREVKNAIVSRLNQENVNGQPIECWESDEKCNSDFSAECIRNIRQSSIVVIIVSDASMDPKSYVFNEVIEARSLEGQGKLNIIVYKLTDTPYTDRFAMQLNHISDANHVSRIQKMGNMGGIDTLVKRVKYLLNCRMNGIPEKPYDAILPRVEGTEITATGYFVDGSRNSIINEIEDAFRRSNVVILSELFGFGKKSVIKKYVQRREYRSAIELQGRHETLYDFLLNGLSFSNINDEAFSGDEKSVIRKKIDLLKKLPENQMLIFSDVDIEDEADDFVIGLLCQLRCHVAIVTQNSASAYRDYFPVIVVGRMENEYLLELFFHYYDRENYLDREPMKPLLESFFEDVGGHTKTVEIAASVLSKEMRADPGELARYVAPNADDKRALNDRIVEKLSSLIALEVFDDNERQTLLIIALMADPVIDVTELYGLMGQCGIFDRKVVTALDEHRWISYDGRNRTVYIEPIIAKICVSKLLSDYSIPKVCAAVLWNEYEKMISRSNGSIRGYYVKMARFFDLLDVPAVSELFCNLLASVASGQIDADKMESVSDHFSEWFRALYSRKNDLDTERDIFLFYSALAIQATFLLPAKMMSQFPLLYGTQGNQPAMGDSIYSILNELLCADMEDYSAASDFFSLGLHNSNEDNVTGYSEEGIDIKEIICDMSADVLCDITDRNLSSLKGHLDKMVEMMMSYPDICSDSVCADSLLATIKGYINYCINSGAYRPGAALCENLLSLPWSSYYIYQMLILYARMLLNLSANDEALGAIEAADDLFDEALMSLSNSDKLTFQREQLVLHTIVLTEVREFDGAMDKFRTLLSIGTMNVEIETLEAADALINGLLFCSKTDAVRRVIDESKEFIEGIIDSNVSDETKERAETILALGDTYKSMKTEQFSMGGIITDKNYYQRYSAEKKNNLIAMMSYNRIADGVRRFNFSSYTEEDFAAHTERLRMRARSGEDRKKLASEAFALVSEAGQRTLGYKHHSSQYVGAAVMLDGKIAEILNGEGKTYTVALVAYVNSLYSDKVFVLDRSRLLTERNYKWMRGLMGLLGVKTEHWEYGSHVNDHVLDSGIVYTDFATLGFDMLNREEISDAEKRWDFSKYCIVVDEADTVLVEEAKKPIQITEKLQRFEDLAEKCRRAYDLASQIISDEEYCRIVDDRIQLMPAVHQLIEDKFGIQTEAIESAGELFNIEQLIRKAISCMISVPGKDFFVRNGRIEIEDTSTGTFFEASAERGYFYSRACKLNCAEYEKRLGWKYPLHNMTYVYGVLCRFGSICGTSATASSFKKEFKDIYGLDTVSVPPALPVKRIDQSVSLYTSREFKDRDIVKMVVEKHAVGQPVLLIVKNVAESQRYSAMLEIINVPHKVLNAATSEHSPDLLSEAGVYGNVLIATQLANRGVDIKLGGDAERMTLRMLADRGCDLSKLEDILYSVPSKEIRESDFYRSYVAELEKNRAIVLKNREKVIEAGGLCVISTDPYEDLRIEQQIRGRAGRQGAVGESYVFESIDDEAIKILCDKKYDAIMYSISSYGLEIIDSKFLKFTIDTARTRLHHAMFKSMKDASELSLRLEQSKKEIFSLVYATECSEDEFNEVLNKVLEIWASDEEVLDWAEFIRNNVFERDKEQSERECIDEIIEANADMIRERRSSGKPCGGIDAIFMLAIKYSDAFGRSDAGETKKFLVDLARCFIMDRVFDPDRALRGRLLKVLSDHLSSMSDIEYAYSNRKMKNIDRTLREAYKKDRQKCLVDIIGRWMNIEGNGIY